MKGVIHVSDEELRQQAIDRLNKRREFQAHLLAYVLVNAFLVVIWAVTGSGFFWPIFPVLGWGIGIAFHAWDVFGEQRPTEDRIQREMERMRR
ncbi:MAG TPA: 2TM domain-containing protein [Actinomycetota bacterium]|nr:2TM domain-containing protein [Actinomycetota bacterium]